MGFLGIVESTLDVALNDRLGAEGGYTRSHALTEIFSALTGKIHISLSANDAAKTIKAMAENLEFVDLSPSEILEGLTQAQKRGGRIHDYVHALAASKAGASVLLTMDKNDFADLVPGITVEQV